jgi:hypothetical protein
MKCEEILADMFVVSCLLSVRDIPIFEAILMLHSKQMSYLAARSSAEAETPQTLFIAQTFEVQASWTLIGP